MLELLEALVRGLLLLGRLILEAGAVLDLSLRIPGRGLLRCLWPPHWLRRHTYSARLETTAGVLFWLLFAFALYSLDQYLAV